MKNKEKTFYTIHDELFCNLVVPTKRKKGAKSSAEFVHVKDKLSVHELILLMILIDYRIKYNQEMAISLSYIHKMYRGKRVGKTEVMSEKDLVAYKRALNGLQSKRICVLTGNTRTRYHQNNKEFHNIKIFKITSIDELRNGDLIFEYTLGEYGEILIESKRYSNILPIRLLKTPYKQYMKIYIALYISKILFISSKRRNKTVLISKESIMKNIRLHDSNGKCSDKTLYELMNEDDLSKYSKLKLFNIYLNEVLEDMKVNDSIISYDLSVSDDTKCQIVLKN